MADIDLTPQSPAAGLDLPKTLGDTTLAEPSVVPMTSVMPFKGKHDACRDALATLGLELGAVGQVGTGTQWMGRGLWFVIGHDPAPLEAALAGLAAVTDQSDGWAVLDLTGGDAAAVLARLTPIDLDPSVFGIGATARTEVAHMAVSVTPTDSGFRLMVLRSFVQTLVEDLLAAMLSIQQQGALNGPG